MKTMMKNSNLMTRVALTLLVMMLTATTAWADDSGSCGNNVTYKYSESTHTLTISGSGAMQNYDGTPPWYSYRKDIKAVVIEDGVTKIGNRAFNECSSLTSVSIPNSVTSIGKFAFLSCSSLKSFSIPNSVTNIGLYSFYSCTSLKYVDVNAETPPTLGSAAFDYNADGRKICVPNSSVDTYKERWGSYANDIVDVSFLFSQDGDTYTIHSATGWDLFCNEVEGGKSFSGKTVVLDDDIVVTRMAGSIAKDFRGTFNGGGHRLTLHYGSVENPVDAQFVAPFPAVAGGAKFIDLTIDGYIHAGYKGSDEPGMGGLIGHLFGNVMVEHCVSNVVINSDKDRVGGFVGLCDHAVAFTDCKSSSVITCTGSSSGFVGWSRSSAYTIAFEGCLFDGKLLQQNGTGVSGGCFVGWKGDAKTVNINNCLVAPATLAEGESMASSGSATFCRQHNDQLPAEIKNSYYTTAFDADQGTQVHSIKAGKGVSVAMAGNVIKKYETSGITFYDTGIMCDGKLYAGKDDEVSLTLSHEDQEGYALTGYEAKDSLQNAVTLTAAGDNYTLTMPNSDVTVTAKVAMLYSLTLPDGMEVVSADPAAIGGKYKEGTSIRFKVNSDYEIEGDVMNGDKVLTADADGIYTVTVGKEDITITASVVLKTYSLTLPDKMEVVSADQAAIGGKYPVGTTIKFTVKSNYAVDGDVKNGDIKLDADADGIYTVTVENADITITATFVKVYSLTLPDGMEVVSAAPAAIDGKYKEGTTIKFKLKSEDYVLEGDVKNGDTVLTADANGNYTVTVGNADITITATVKKAVEPNVILTGGDYTAQNGDVLTGSTSGTVTIAKDASITLSDVTINGGIVCEGTATIILVGENSVTGLNYNAGIQVGDSGTTLTIKGNGALTATGGYGSAGIGTGSVFDETTFGDIIIEGGNITANGGDSSAGIGTSCVDSGGSVTLGDIIIKGGSITANGGSNGAGIGMGYVCSGTATLSNITIEGGSITANGGSYGAGIGTGEVDESRTVTLGDITIKGGIITANGGRMGAGIGTGFVWNGSATLDNITIKGGSITANGGEDGAGIGTGDVWNGTVTLGTLTIYDDIDLVDATGDRKSGISEEVVYMHGESDVTEDKSEYFDINDEGEHVVIESKKHTITLVNDGQHGTVTVVAKEMSGESVTITVTPDNGYMLDTIEVKDANGNEVELDEDDMSFIMPDSNVTITVTWKLKGDVNGNGTVDISDVVALVNAILNDESNDAYDVSGDNAVDINDVVALVNLILNN